MALFSTDLRGNKLEISNYVLGSAPLLRRIGIVSSCDEALSVSFRSSDLGDMIVFQSENPNSSSTDEPAEYCNEMFNMINVIDSVLLPPRQTVFIVLQFAPLKGEPAFLEEQRKKGNRGDDNGRVDRFFSIRGRVQMFTDADVHRNLAPCVVSLSVAASVCHSVLTTDVSHLLFENCELGAESQVREFRITNASEAPLKFLVAQRTGHCVLPAGTDESDQEGPPLTFTHYDTGAALDTSQVQRLAGFAQTTIRVTYMPLQVGVFKYEILLRNLCSKQSSEMIEVHADVTSDKHHSEVTAPFCLVRQQLSGLVQVLQVSTSTSQLTDKVMDWGEGHMGVPLYETVILKNISGDQQLIQMTSDRQAEVSFHLSSTFEAEFQSPQSSNGNSWNTHRSTRKNRSFNASVDVEKSGIPEASSSDNLQALQAAMWNRGTSIRKHPSLEGTSLRKHPSLDSNFSTAAREAYGFSQQRSEMCSRVLSKQTSLDAHQLKAVSGRQVPSTDAAKNTSAEYSTALEGSDFEFNDPDSSEEESEGHELDAQRHQIEELVLLAGKTLTLFVKYQPTGDALVLDRRTFRLTFRCQMMRSARGHDEVEQQAGNSQARKGFSTSLKCRVKVCRTQIEVLPQQLLLGDCMYGQSRSGTFVLRNLSDMATEMRISHDSRVLSLSHEVVHLKAQECKEVAVKFAPVQGVNKYFNKEVEFRNVNNSNDVHHSQVCASVKNPDKSTVHSLFYKATPRRVNFGCLNIDSPTPCMMKVRNVSKSPITVMISTSLPEQLQVFVCTKLQQGSPLHLTASNRPTTQRENARLTDKKQMLIEMVENESKRAAGPKRIEKHLSLDDVSVSSESCAEDVQKLTRLESVKLAEQHVRSRQGSQSTQSRSRQNSVKIASSELPTTQAEGAAKHGVDVIEDGSAPDVDISEVIQFWSEPLKWYFGQDVDSEQQHIERVLTNRKSLMKALSTVYTALQAPLVIEPHSSVDLVLLLNAESTPIPLEPGNERYGQLQLLQAELNVRLLEYDKTLYQLQDDQEGSTQSIPVEAKVCSTVIDLVQTSIHFGVVDVHSRHEVNITIGNLSDLPLIYRIVKSGNFASKALEFPKGHLGIVRAFGSIDVPMTFCPTFDGDFDESFTIENAIATSSFETIHVKSSVTPRRIFWLEKLQISCGCVIPNSRSTPCRIVLTNSTRQRRTFCIDVAKIVCADDLKCIVTFWLEHVGMARDVEKAEESVEDLERALKIAIRKGKDGKRDDILQQIGSLKQRQLWEGGLDKVLQSDSEDENKDKKGKTKADKAAPGKASEAIKSSAPTEEVSNAAAAAAELLPQVGQGSITFTVDANTCQTILMGVKVVTDLPEVTQLEQITGQLQVNEVKNQDDLKFIDFSLDVCSDAQIRASPDDPAAPEMFCASPTQMLPPSVLPFEDMDAISLSPPIIPRRSAGYLIVSPECIELGDVHVAYRSRATCTLANPLNNPPIAFSIVKAVVAAGLDEVDVLTFTPESGQIEPGDSISINVVCNPLVPGNQVHEAVVRSRQMDQTWNESDQTVIQFSMSATHREYLSFPSLRNNTLNAGMVHVDPSSGAGNLAMSMIGGVQEAGSKVVEFQVRSTSKTPVLISASTNMKQQAYVYASADRRGEVRMLELKPYKGVKLYLHLRPTSQGPNSRQEDFADLYARYANGECREIVGGIHFDVFSPEAKTLGRTTIKFKSLIGCSKLLVEPARIDLRCTAAIIGTTIKHTLKLTNSNSRIELPFKITATGNLQVDQPEGKLAGTADGSKSSLEICCTMRVDELGLSREQLVISNLNSPGFGNALIVPVLLFVDDGTMHTSTNKATANGSEQQSVLPIAKPSSPLQPPESTLLRTDTLSDADADTALSIDFGMLYIDPERVDPLAYAERKLSFCLRLNEDEAKMLLLQPMSDLAGLRVLPAAKEEAFNAANAHLRSPNQQRMDSVYGLVTCGDPIVTRVGEETDLIAELHYSALNVEELRLDSSWHNHVLHFDKQLVFYSTALKQVLQLLHVRGTHCVSHAELGSSSVNVGSIGYVSRYQDEPFEFEICNRTAAPLSYHIDLPEGIIIDQSDMARTVPPLETYTVSAAVHTSMGDLRHGNAVWTLVVTNDNNSANELEFVVHATVSACVLQYEGLSTSDSRDLSPRDDFNSLCEPPASPTRELPSLKLGVPWNAEGHQVFEETMVMRNMLNGSIDAILQLRQPDDAIATLQLLSSEHGESDHLEHMTSSRVELGDEEEAELGVRVQLGPGGAAELFGELPSPRHKGSSLQMLKKQSSGDSNGEDIEENQSMVLLGELHITPVGHDVEIIPVFACLNTNKTSNSASSSWSLSNWFLHMAVPHENMSSVESFKVHNVSTTATVEISVSLDTTAEDQLPSSFEISLTPDLFQIGPGKTEVVHVELKSAGLSVPLPESFTVVILVSNESNERESSKQIELTIQNSLDDPQVDGQDSDESADESSESASVKPNGSPGLPSVVVKNTLSNKPNNTAPTTKERLLPVMELRGCTPLDSVGRHYELEFGQQACEEGTMQWELTLNMQQSSGIDAAERMRWSMCTADPSIESWLSISTDGGELGRHEDALLVLSFNKQHVGIYTTHLIITNHSNPSDMKVVKVMMEVASYHPKTESEQAYFDVRLQGTTQDKKRLTIPIAIPGQTYTDNSFMLVNQSELPLLFFITSDLRTQKSLSELCFSLSQNSLRLFQSIEINPQSQQRIYLHYTPRLPDGVSSGREEIVISVNCRQIKDFRRSVTLSSNIQPPWISIDDHEMWLHCPPVPADEHTCWPPAASLEQCQEFECTLQITNPWQNAAMFVVKSAMHFFTVELDGASLSTCNDDGDGKELLVPAGESTTLTVKLNLSSLGDCRHIFKRQRFLEEHFSLYNCNSVFEVGSCEYHQILVRLCIAPVLVRKVMRVAVFDVGSKAYHASSILEVRVVDFLQTYATFWSQLAPTLENLDTVLPHEQLRALGAGLQGNADHAALFVEFSFLTDEIVFYGIKGNASGGQTHLFINHLSHLIFAASLASCAPFNAVLRQFHGQQEPLPPPIAAWIHKLEYALGRLPAALCQPGSTLSSYLNRFAGLKYTSDRDGGTKQFHQPLVSNQ